MRPKRPDVTFAAILHALNRARVRYLVAGGMAVNLHGIPRFTRDLDLYVSLSKPNMLRAIKTLQKLGFRPTIPVTPEAAAEPKNRKGWIEKKGMVVFSMNDPNAPFHPIDIFIRHSIPFEQAWKRRKVVPHEDTLIPILSIKDLITLKRIAGRLQDLSDIKMLRKL